MLEFTLDILNEWFVDYLDYLFYALGTVLFLWLFGFYFGKRWIQKKRATAKQIRYELAKSAQSMVVFIAYGILVYIALNQDLVYSDIAQYGWLWLPVSFVIIAVVDDAYFYWTHRWFHSSSKVFKWVHKVHHRSVQPTPFTSYSFSVLEAINVATATLVLLFIMPIHESVLIAYSAYISVKNVIGHCGREVYPRWLILGPLGFITSVTHHDLHHSSFRYNFSLSFTWWDRLCGTEHPDYLKVYNQVTQPQQEARI